jgi:hypothetical protein
VGFADNSVLDGLGASWPVRHTYRIETRKPPRKAALECSQNAKSGLQQLAAERVVVKECFSKSRRRPHAAAQVSPR